MINTMISKKINQNQDNDAKIEIWWYWLKWLIKSRKKWKFKLKDRRWRV